LFELTRFIGIVVARCDRVSVEYRLLFSKEWQQSILHSDILVITRDTRPCRRAGGVCAGRVHRVLLQPRGRILLRQGQRAVRGPIHGHMVCALGIIMMMTINYNRSDNNDNNGDTNKNCIACADITSTRPAGSSGTCYYTSHD
jgi:hypothetical protein